MSHLVANEMGFKLNGVRIDLAGTLNPAKVFGQSDEDRAGYKEITVRTLPIPMPMPKR